MDTLTIRLSDNGHLHIRQGQLMRQVLPFTTRAFGRALIMPNTKGPILNAADVVEYRQQIEAVRDVSTFEPLMTIKLTHQTTPEIIEAAAQVGVVAAKLYPIGVTTNAHDGISNWWEIRPALRKMAELGMILCIHGEKPGADYQTAEIKYSVILSSIARRVPGLKIVLEHISTWQAVHEIMLLPQTVAATITPHHLWLTEDDVFEADQRTIKNPWHYCKPTVKAWVDRQALRFAATSGNPKFFAGTDSAPHPPNDKKLPNPLPGTFCEPTAIETYAEVFEQEDRLDKLESFMSEFFAQFYGLPLNKGTITLVKRPQSVPADYGGMVPLRAGETIPWQIETT